jgi:hypothetical protein
MSLRNDTIIAGAVNPTEGKVVEVPSHQAINEKKIVTVGAGDEVAEKQGLEADVQAAPPLYDADGHNHGGDDKDSASDDVIIVTGADAAAHLLPMRDDGEPALTFRSIVLATVLSGFQAVMNQIYSVCAGPIRLVHGV